MEPRNVLLSSLLSIAVGIIVIIVSNLIVTSTQNRDPRLEYTPIQYNTFKGTQGNLGFYSSSILNPSKVAVKDVVEMITVNYAQLQIQIKADPTLLVRSDISGDTVTLNIPEFNPGDSVGLSIFATSTTDLPNNPHIALRGSGITGSQYNPQNSSSNIWLQSLSIFGLLAGFGTFLFITSRFDRRQFGETNDVFAYLCNVRGLKEEATYYRNKSTKSSYWSEADRFVEISESVNSNEKIKNLRSVLTDLVDYGDIGTKSLGIIHYDIARLDLFLKENPEMIKNNIKIAKSKAGKIIDSRLIFEPELKKYT